MTTLLVCLAGGFGALARAGVDSLVARRFEPWLATLVINVVGSFLLGVASQQLSGAALTVIGAGFLGAFTTFSTACWQSARELGRSNWRFAAGYTAATVSLALAAAWAGVAVGA